jgi:hypothetical protein
VYVEKVVNEKCPNAYGYTRLGKIESPNGLLQALGSGNVTVRFELLSKR